MNDHIVQRVQLLQETRQDLNLNFWTETVQRDTITPQEFFSIICTLHELLKNKQVQHNKLQTI